MQQEIAPIWFYQQKLIDYNGKSSFERIKKMTASKKESDFWH